MSMSKRLISEILPWLFLAVILIIGVPLFICMPLWVDTTYHDLSARNLLWGGVHYRDIFETNLPGMVWIQALVRVMFGWSSEAIRTVDLVVVGSSAVLLWRFLKRIEVPRSTRAWFLAAVCLFYVFETEFIHCQRDSWMLLPAIVALHLRSSQLATANRATMSATFRTALLQGAAWGCSIWIKPHTVVPAGFVWLASFRRLEAAGKHRTVGVDFLGLLTGGALVGGIGVVWLICTGTWPYMWDVLLNWNPEYYKWTIKEMDQRLSMVIMYFAPWSLIHFASLPVAVAALIRARVWKKGSIAGVNALRMDQALISSLYLGWFAQAVLLQKTFHYTQAPVHFLALAVMAAHRWPASQIFIGWCLVGGTLNYLKDANDSVGDVLKPFQEARPRTYQQVIPRNKLINGDWKSVWLKCATEGSSPEIKDHLSFYRYIHCAPTWTELREVSQFLETLNLKDGELVCWDDTTHPLYLDLHIRPGIRFMHVNTALDFRSKRPIIREELIASHHRYVVSDMGVILFLYDFFCTEPPSGRPLDLPEDFPCFCRDVYPWNQPIIFKAGRYSVHRVENPIDDIRIPYPLKIDMP